MRRTVRLDVRFLFALDDQLGDGRGPAGQPSAGDVLLIDLPEIVETFAVEFDRMPPLYEGREDYRYSVITGRLFTAAVVTAQLMPDGTVVLLDIEIEL